MKKALIIFAVFAASLIGSSLLWVIVTLMKSFVYWSNEFADADVFVALRAILVVAVIITCMWGPSFIKSFKI